MANESTGRSLSALEGARGARVARTGCAASAVGAGVARALARSHAVVLTARGGYVGVRVRPPEFSWHGRAVSAVSSSQRHRIEALVRESLSHEVEHSDIFANARASMR